MRYLTIAARRKHNKIPFRKELIQCSLLSELQPCDIILYRFKGKKDFMGGAIAHFTNSPYSHAEIHLYDGYTVSAESIGVIYKDILAQRSKIDVFRFNAELTREQKHIILSKAHQSVFKPYHFINLFWFPFVSNKKAAEWSKNNAFMCSEVVSWCYREAGIDLNPDQPEAIEAPADLGMCDLLDYVGTYYVPKGRLYDVAMSNLRFSDENVGRVSYIVGELMKAFSKRDELYY